MGKASTKKVGRPSPYMGGYSSSFPDLGRKLALLGAKDAQMAAVFGVGEATLKRWKDEHPEFRSALSEGKEQADAGIAASLYHRAMGYEHPDTDIRVVNGEIVQTRITKHYPPDTTACIFWLKNRQREQWRDKIETGVTDKDGNDIPPADPMESARKIAFLLAKAASEVT